MDFLRDIVKENGGTMIKVKYQLKECSNSTLFKFFKTEEQVETFKFQNPHYIFE